MATELIRDVLALIQEKIAIRSKRIGVPENAVSIVPSVSEGSSGCSHYTLQLVENLADGSVLYSELMTLSFAGSCVPLKITATVEEDIADTIRISQKASAAESDMSGHKAFRFECSTPDDAAPLALFAADVMQNGFESYETHAEPFACCSRQYTCSIKGECLHPDQMYAKACLYRKTLLQC